MILSTQHNFLLLKNQKVGGTSLEVPISFVVPDNAIVTPRTSNHPAWKIKNEFYHNGYAPRNYSGFYNHMSYSEISQKIDLSDVKSYVFVRNPYNVVLSHFFHRLYFINKNTEWGNLKSREKEILIKKYFDNDLGWPWIKSNRKIYVDSKNNIQVTKILKYELGIEKQINPILKIHGLKEITLSLNEKSFRPHDINYFDVFNDKQIQLIKNEWIWEFDNLGYEY